MKKTNTTKTDTKLLSEEMNEMQDAEEFQIVTMHETMSPNP